MSKEQQAVPWETEYNDFDYNYGKFIIGLFFRRC